MRVAGGLGTVARAPSATPGDHHQRISIDDALRRIEGLYKPYHRALRRLLTRVPRFRHRGPDRLPPMPPPRRHYDDRPRADIVLGDRHGTSGSDRLETVDVVPRTGYVVSRTNPMRAVITEHYGNPAAGLHLIQIEINRALYRTSGAMSAAPRSTARRHPMSPNASRSR